VLGVPRDKLGQLSAEAERLYSPFTLVQVKRGKRKERPIDNPLAPLKNVQTRIKERLLDPVDLPSFMCGGVRGRSTQANARIHVCQSEVVALDVRNFFGSVTCAQVAGVWHERFGASNDVAWLLTRLTTYGGHLPQGAPTSTALANLVMLPTMERLHLWCRDRGLRLSIYVDDMSVSGKLARVAIPVVASELSRARLRLARGKVKVMPSHVRQEVTGLVVNRRLSNTRETLQRARSLLFAALSPTATDDDRRRAHGLIAHVCATSANQGKWFASKLPTTTSRLPSSDRSEP
jgi:RNA-directed DNA polymerase